MGSARKIHQADTEKGFQVREQVCQAPKEGCRVQLPKPAEDGQEEGVLDGRRRGRWGRGWGRCRGSCRGRCLNSSEVAANGKFAKMENLQKWKICKNGKFAKMENLLPKAIASHLDCLNLSPLIFL